MISSLNSEEVVGGLVKMIDAKTREEEQPLENSSVDSPEGNQLCDII